MTKEAMKPALEALEDFSDVIKYDNENDDIGYRACCHVLSYDSHSKNCKATKAITALQEALAEQPAPVQQEPVALLNEISAEPTEMIHKWRVMDIIKSFPPQGIYYTPPAQRKPLTGEEMNQIEARWDASMHGSKIAFVVRETEAAHDIKEKNT